jgi:hypothetical protein
METLYCEEFECDLLEDSKLYSSYCSTVESQKDNEDFIILYKIDEKFALHITHNIYIYHLWPKNGEIYSSIVPWFYADGEKYFGDSWWHDDIEIIDDFKNFSSLDFLKKYKGY